MICVVAVDKLTLFFIQQKQQQHIHTSRDCGLFQRLYPTKYTSLILQLNKCAW